MIHKRVMALIVVGLLVVPLTTQAQSARERLQNLTAQLQKAPSDEGLRETIIKLELTLDPKPATPIAATQAEGGAEYAFKNAQSASDYADSAKQYEKALLVAPWIAADYFNCGVAHEKAGENSEAIRSFSLYLLAAPNAGDALEVNKRIGGLQYAEQRRVSDEAARVATAKVEETVRRQAEDVYRGLDGGIWLKTQTYVNDAPVTFSNSSHEKITLEIQGHDIAGFIVDDLNARRSFGLHTTFTSRQFQADNKSLTISEDGKTITENFVWSASNSGWPPGTKFRTVYRRVH
jgi:tetratricopeptide (TPR) repeat protein